MYSQQIGWWTISVLVQTFGRVVGFYLNASTMGGFLKLKILGSKSCISWCTCTEYAYACKPVIFSGATLDGQNPAPISDTSSSCLNMLKPSQLEQDFDANNPTLLRFREVYNHPSCSSKSSPGHRRCRLFCLQRHFASALPCRILEGWLSHAFSHASKNPNMNQPRGCLNGIDPRSQLLAFFAGTNEVKGWHIPRLRKPCRCPVFQVSPGKCSPLSS